MFNLSLKPDIVNCGSNGLRSQTSFTKDARQE